RGGGSAGAGGGSVAGRGGRPGAGRARPLTHPRKGGALMRRLAWLSIGVLLSLTLAGTASAEPLKIRYSIWVGYGPLFLAQEKGFFKEENVEVQLVNVEDPKEGFFAMAAGRLDGVVSTIDTMVLYLK